MLYGRFLHTVIRFLLTETDGYNYNYIISNNNMYAYIHVYKYT
jgi:hypothetical protein